MSQPVGRVEKKRKVATPSSLSSSPSLPSTSSPSLPSISSLISSRSVSLIPSSASSCVSPCGESLPTHYLTLWCPSDGKIRRLLSGVEHVATLKGEGDEITIKWVWKERQGDKDLYTTRTRLAANYICALTCGALRKCLELLDNKNGDSGKGNAKEKNGIKYEITKVLVCATVGE